jgi:UDP-2,3-diacylglucosamine pyrophosphatase LpxH
VRGSADTFSERNLNRLLGETPVQPLDDSGRIVVFSDLHLGNGGPTDDFADNARLFEQVVRDHYLSEGYTLILNGDIEELQRFRLKDILSKWSRVYALFDAFKQDGRLYRLVGNHDMALLDRSDHGFEVHHALRFAYRGQTIFVFHGHQTSIRFERFNGLVGLGLRWFADPLRVTNYSVAHDSQKRFRAEQRVYEFASANALMAIIGHTHRPLFESMSKVDTIRFEIERLCRKYPRSSPKKQRSIEQKVRSHREELARIRAEDDARASVSSLYNASLLIPCVFNSGTVIGKRGMTCIELCDGAITLAHWFDEKRSRKYLEYADYATSALRGTDYHRVEIKSDALDYIFARIRLLAGA